MAWRTDDPLADDQPPDFETLLAPHRLALESRLGAIVGLRSALHVPAGGMTPIDDMAAYQLASGGKRLRGLLPAAVVSGGGGPVEAAIEFGACIELVHNGTLVHDDIQDGDRERRGRPTLWTVVGEAQAINAGDALLVAPVAHLLRSDVIPQILRPKLALLLADAIVQTVGGQAADVAAHANPMLSLDDLGQIHQGKTAPLFDACLMGAALLLGLGDGARTAVAAMAADLGLAFQIRDDLLDALGAKGRGEAGADLYEGKLTWPMLKALESATESEAARFRSWLRPGGTTTAPTAAAVAEAVAWMHAQGGVAAAEFDLAHRLDRTRAAAADLYPGPAAAVVHALCHRLARLDG